MVKELIFGSEEWMDELNKLVNFPQMFVIYYGLHRETNKAALHVVKVDTKSKEPKNIKYSSLSTSLTMALAPYKWLIEGVHYIENADEYLSKMKELSKRWDVDFNN